MTQALNRYGAALRGLLHSCSANEVLQRKVSATVINGPGINGSALVGQLLKSRHSVIASVTKAAQSIIRRSIQLNRIALELDSATNVESSDSLIRTVNISETETGLDRTRLILTMFSNDHPLSSRSGRLLRLVGGHGALMVVGGSSLLAMFGSRCVVYRGVLRMSSGWNSNFRRLGTGVCRVFGLSDLSSSTRVFTGRQRGGYYRMTLRSIVLTGRTVRVNRALSTLAVVISEKTGTLLRLANRGAARTIISSIFAQFYMKGWRRAMVDCRGCASDGRG